MESQRGKVRVGGKSGEIREGIREGIWEGIWEECNEGGCRPEDAFARNGSAPARRRVLADSILRSDRRPHVDWVNKKRGFVHEGGLADGEEG